MLLIYPPLTKGCEAPAGIHRLAGVLRQQGHSVSIWDANLEGQLWLFEQPPPDNGTWAARAFRNRSRSLAILCDPQHYHGDAPHYRNAVSDLDHLLACQGKPYGFRLGLADCRHDQLVPVRSADLRAMSETPELSCFYRYFSETLPQRLANATAVGISLTFLSQALITFGLIGQIRRLRPDLPIYLGGGLITSWQQYPGWDMPFRDLINKMVRGPGEQEICQLLGLSLAATPPDPLASHPAPDPRYLSPGFILPYACSSGCWWNQCSFCPERAERTPYRQRPIRQVRAELTQLIATHRPALVHLLDNALSPALLQSLAAEPLGAPFYGFVRFSEELEDPGFCRALKRSGCLMVKLGIESGDDQVLQALQKGTGTGRAARVLSSLAAAGIGVYGYFLFGTPAENREAAGVTKEFIRLHHHEISFLNLAIFNMPVFGEDAALHQTGRFYDGDLSLYTGFQHPAEWGRGDIRRFLRQELTRIPEVAAIVRRDPPRFGSNHAAFLLPHGGCS